MIDKLGVALQRRILRLHQIDQAQRLGGETIGQIEARQRQPRMIGIGAGQPRHVLAAAAVRWPGRSRRSSGPSRRKSMKLGSLAACAIAWGVSPMAVCGGVSDRPPGREMRTRVPATETTRSSA